MKADPLTEALLAEHAAIFGYGVVGAHLDDAGKEAARQAEAAHRDRRDALTERMTPAAVPALPAYDLPFEVTDPTSAVRLAVEIEEGTAQAWARVLAVTTGDDRKHALDALTDSAVRATRWRAAAGITPSTVTFPGLPS